MDKYLQIINQDYSFDTVLAVIQQYLEEIDDKQWKIGTILVWVRFRSRYSQVTEFDLIPGQPWPEELHEYLRKQYGLEVEDGRPSEFLSWQKLDFDKLVILSSQDKATLWQADGLGLTDAQFDSYLKQLDAQLRARLNGKTMWSYYITALHFPPGKQLTDAAWTFHLEQYFLAKANYDADPDQYQSFEEVLDQTIADLQNRGITTVSKVRELTDQVRQDGRGYHWYIDLPEQIFIMIGGRGGRKVPLLTFTDEITSGEKKFFLSSTGIGRFFYNQPGQVIWRDRQLEIEGRVVATLAELEVEPEVDKAVIYLAGRMGWVVK